VVSLAILAIVAEETHTQIGILTQLSALVKLQ